MNRQIVLDTGPLVAYVSRRDRYHEWAQEVFKSSNAPMLTCDAVIAEACWLLAEVPNGRRGILSLVERRVTVPSFDLASEVAAVSFLMDQYANVPMDFADACLVRMAELIPEGAVLTIDSDLRVYRKHRGVAIRTLMPPTA